MATTTGVLLSMSDPVFRSFIGYAGVVLGKMLLMSSLTAYKRVTKKVFATEEDTKYFKVTKKGVVQDEDVERVRRAHQNDVENILPFVLIGLLYTATGPSLATALLHFRVFTAARILHSVVYVASVPQPARAVTYFTSQLVTMSLVVQVIRQASF